MRRCFPLVCCALAVVLLPSPVPAQNTSALINEQLDKLVKLNLQKTTLPQAIATIATDTGVRIDASSAVWELLPWGEQTTIDAKIENQTLRGALQAITRKLGLTFELGDEAVQLRPLPALKRLGRRATVEELEVLDLLARTPLDASAEHLTIKQLLAMVDSKLDAAKSPFAVENRAFTDSGGSKEIGVARNTTLLEALEAIAQTTDATWYPWGKTLVVVPKVDQVRNQLAKTITIRFPGVDIAQVLSELSARSGVDFIYEPGAVQRVPMDSRNVRLMLENASIQQALESIMGFTGLAYSINDKGVYIWNPSSAGGGGGREPAFGIITLDNGLQVLVRESQVPADLREYVKFKSEKQWTKIREMMKEEGFKPATRPATQPATSRRSDDL